MLCVRQEIDVTKNQGVLWRTRSTMEMGLVANEVAMINSISLYSITDEMFQN